jgi:hypothetical protein
MKKLFIIGIIWEIVRFTTLYLTTITKINGDLILFFTSQQLIIFYIYFFLLRDTEKYSQYLKILTAGKFLSCFAGLLYIFKLLLPTSFSVSEVLYPANIVFIDSIFFTVLLIATIKYFKAESITEE